MKINFFVLIFLLSFSLEAQEKNDSYCQNCKVIETFFNEEILYKPLHISQVGKHEGIRVFQLNFHDTVTVLDMSRDVFYCCKIDSIKNNYFKLLESDFIPQPLNSQIIFKNYCLNTSSNYTKERKINKILY